MTKIFIDAVDLAVQEVERRKQAAGYFSDPAKWLEYMTGMRLWNKQKEVAQSVMNNKSVVVKAGHGVGKSFLAAVLVCHWMDTRYPNAYVATTAPSTAQVNAILWREVRKIKAIIEKRFNEGLIDHKLPGYITADAQWKDDDGNLLGFGRKPPDGKEDDAFQGLHDAYVLAVGDESVGLSESIIDALGNITSNENSRRLLICNPTNPASYVGKLFREKKENWLFDTISVYDSPNFTDERFEMSDEALEKLVGPQYVEDKKQEYGENSARFKSRVLGEFAFDSEDILITPEDIEKAKSIEIEIDVRSSLGVDVARMGSDRSVVYSNKGGKIRFVDSWQSSPTTETANRVHRLALETGANVVFVDSDGVGGGVKDQLVQICEGLYYVVEVHGSAASPDRRQWHNFRAYMWDNFRLRCSQNKIDLDPLDEDLHDELMSARYTFNKQSGGLLIESKEDMKKRGMKSPDLADAAVYASLEWDADNPLSGYVPGDKVYTDPSEILGTVPEYLSVMRSW